MLDNNASLKELIDAFELVNDDLIDRGLGQTITPSTSNKVLPRGNYRGDITVIGDSDLISENIKEGVNIFGVNGTMKEYKMPTWFDIRNDFWITYTENMPISTAEATSTIIGSKIYVLGGESSSFKKTKNNLSYNTSDNTWTINKDLPLPIKCAVVETVNNKIYCIGGANEYGNEVNNNQCYIISTDSYETKTAMPTKRSNAASATVENNIYVIFGYAKSTSTDLKKNEKYDTVTNTWSTKTQPSTAYRSDLSAVSYNNKIYCFGGCNNSNGNKYKISEVYDTVLDTWSSLPDMLNTRYLHDCVIKDNKIYCIGGWDPLGINECFDISTNTWSTKRNKNINTWSQICEVSDNYIYSFGGYFRSSNTFITSKGEFYII